jgi:hypothetical protein
MSKTEIIKNLKVEIKRLNRAIDTKIVRGVPYTVEAHKHKLLRAQLSLIRQKSFLARSMRLVSMFLF